MKFSERFKLIWWVILTLFLSVLLLIRFKLIIAGGITNFDLFILVFWFLFILYPLFSEITLFGISVKKEIDNLRNEIKNYFFEFKSEIKNDVKVQPIINVNNQQAKPQEYKEKVKEEAKEILGKKTSQVTIEKVDQKIYKPKTDYMKEKIKKIFFIEKKITAMMKEKYGKDFSPHIKFENNLGNKLIVDGIIFDETGIVNEIIEIRFITTRSFEAFKYVAGRFLKKIIKFGLYNTNLRLIVVSEEITSVDAQKIKDDIGLINLVKPSVDNKTIPKLNIEFYRLDKNQLIVVKPTKNEY